MAKMRSFNTKAMKVSTSKVKEMYNRMLSGELNQREAALEYGIGVIQAGRIARGESRAQETGALSNPIPNFNMKPLTLEESMAETKRRMDEVEARKAPSLYSDPPPEGYDDGVNPEALERLGVEVENHPTTRVGNELDKLEKGD